MSVREGAMTNISATERHAGTDPRTPNETPERRSARGLPRRRFLNDMPDKGLFGFVAVFGFANIIALKRYSYDPDVVAGLAVALMVGYGLIAYRIPEVHLRLDRLGDNFYYLGFIFTLASLSAVLIQLRADTDPNIKAIIGDFGIALFTTIVGVAGRVILTQMRTEIDDVEAAIRRDILEASNDLRMQLSLSLREFETFHKSVQQVVAEGLTRTDDVLEKQIGHVASAAGVAISRINDASQAHQKHATALATNISEIAASVADLRKRLGAVKFPTERIDQQLATFGEGLESLAARVSAALEELERGLSAVKFPTKEIERKLESFGTELEQRLLTRLAVVADEIEKASKKKRRWWSLKR
jgi:hypothetical protein